MSNADRATILVVDDHEAARYSRSRILRRANYIVIEAGTGKEALAAIAEHRPTLVLLDVHLPDMSGFEVCGQIKSDPATSVVPVVHMSATSVSTPDQVRGLEGGADGYLVEPVSPEVLVATVGALVRMHRAERLARKNQQVMDVLVGNLPGAAYQTDALGGPLKFVSNRVEDMIGRPAAEVLSLPRGWLEFVEAADRQRLDQQLADAVARKAPFECTYRVRWPDGSTHWISDCVTPVPREDGRGVFWEGFATDVTERIKAQEVIAREQDRLEALVLQKTEEVRRSHEQLRLSERLAAIGTLAAGLGHDMGNLLLPVRMRLEMLMSMPLPSDAKENLSAIDISCDYLKKLAGGLRMLALDASTSAANASVEVKEWGAEVLPLLTSMVPRQLKLTTTFPSSPCWIRIGKTAMTQIAFNLIQNAADAMRSQGSGSIHLSIEPINSQAAELSVSDTGPGMSEEVRRRCLEPFFTTKPRGVSTGLGLALVHGLVRDALGTIDVVSAPAKGTIFKLRLHQMPDPRSPQHGPAGVAVLDIADARTRAMVAEELRRMSIEVRIHGTCEVPADAFLVADSSIRVGHLSSRVLLLDDSSEKRTGVYRVPRHPRVQQLRDAVKAMVQSTTISRASDPTP